MLLELNSGSLGEFAVASERFVRAAVPSARVEFRLVDVSELEDEIDTGEPIVPIRASFAEAYALPREARRGLAASWRGEESRTVARIGVGLDVEVLSISLAPVDSSSDGRAEAVAVLVDYLRDVVAVTRPRCLVVSSIPDRPQGGSGAALGYSGYYEFPAGTVSGYPFLAMLTEVELAVLGEAGLRRVDALSARFERCTDADGRPVVLAALDFDWLGVREAALRQWKVALGPLVPPQRRPRLGTLARYVDYAHAVLPEDWPADRRSD